MNKLGRKILICIIFLIVILTGVLYSTKISSFFKEKETSKNNITNELENNNHEDETTSDMATDTIKIPSNNKIIVIDPGHQRKGNNELEPIGPSAEEMKAKVTTGASGIVTGQLESELNLAVSLKIKDLLIQKGYQVVMIRETQDVNMSNSERANIANEKRTDAFIRIHADSLDNSEVGGTHTICQSPLNPYNGTLSATSCHLAKLIVDRISNQTGFRNRGVVQRDDMSGINWSQVPTTIVEMGFLSNPTEDQKLATDEYQDLIATAIVEGIEEYLK